MGAGQEYTWTLPFARVTFDVSSATDTGLVRKVNEDSLLAVPPLFLVADGMGGHAAGDVASQETARILLSRLPEGRPTTSAVIIESISQANDAVRELTGDEFSGTTLSGVALVQDDVGLSLHWMAFNVGDSRVYSWDGTTLVQVSVDHSAVQEMVDEGLISADEAAVHPDRNVITRAIGIGTVLNPDVWLLPAGGPQGFVICSDGLTKELDDRAIEEVLTLALTDQSAADRLVAAALASGGSDNISVVVLRASVDAVAAPHAAVDESDALPAHLQETLPRI